MVCTFLKLQPLLRPQGVYDLLARRQYGNPLLDAGSVLQDVYESGMFSLAVVRGGNMCIQKATMPWFLFKRLIRLLL